jgi:hydroxymethylpyrimidine pyrophosphatase-like HAD family hydrolase
MTPSRKMIVVDIDGTLLPSAGMEVSPRNCCALREAQSAGIEVVIATGRRQAYATPLLSPIGLRPETLLITSNGAVTRTLAGDLIDRFFLPVGLARALCPALREFGAVVFTFDREGSGELVLESLEQAHGRIALWVNANRPWIREVRPLERAFDAGDAPVQGMVCGSVAAMRRAEGWLADGKFSSEIALHRTDYPARDLTILDILPRECSKGASVRRLAGKRGIRREDILALGDNWNDLDMLESAGTAVVMASGAPDLVEEARKRGWTIAPGNDFDGVAEVIESVLSQIRVSGMVE